MRAGVGPDMEVVPSGLAGPVRTRAASERDVELWIDYSFAIRSTAQLKQPVAAK